MLIMDRLVNGFLYNDHALVSCLAVELHFPIMQAKSEFCAFSNANIDDNPHFNPHDLYLQSIHVLQL